MQPCSHPRCPILVRKGTCAEHTTGPRADHSLHGNSRERGYDARWDALSLAFRRLYPLCGMRPNGARPVMSECHLKGRSTPAEQVDHVIPHKGDRELMFDESNLQSLCRACHGAKSRAGL